MGKAKKEITEEATPIEVTKPVKAQKKNPVLNILLLLLVLAIGICIGFGISKLTGEEETTKTQENKKEDKKEDKEEEKPENHPPVEDDTSETPTKEEINDENYMDQFTPTTKHQEEYASIEEEAEALIPYTLCGEPLLDYSKKSIELKDLSDKDKIYMIINVYKKFAYVDPYDKELLVMDENDLKRYFDDLSFLKRIRNNEEGSGNNDPYYLGYKDGKYYLYAYVTGCAGGEGDSGYKLIKKETKKNGNTLTIEYYSRYDDIYYNEDEGRFHWDVYTDETKKTALGKDIEDINEIDKSKLIVIKFTFDLSNNKVRFVSMKK